VSGDWRAKLGEWAQRVTERAADPEFQAQAHRLAREADEAAALARVSLRGVRGIPRAFHAGLGAPKETAALDAVRAFMGTEDKTVLLLAGDVGRGKSFAAAWAVDTYGGRFIEANDVIAASIYDQAGQDRYMLPSLLVVDELGMEPLDQGGWGESKFYDLLNGRIQNLRRTILVTNLGLSAFVARYPDARLRDRLRAYARAHFEAGPSMRSGK
jgi:DNA replication protein DnaC